MQRAKNAARAKQAIGRVLRERIMSQNPTDATNLPTFHEWLTNQSERDDAVGGLARDARRDPSWPKDKPNARPNLSYRKCRDYLALTVGGESESADALERAISEHRATRSAATLPTGLTLKQ